MLRREREDGGGGKIERGEEARKGAKDAKERDREVIFVAMADTIAVAFLHQIDPQFKSSSWLGTLGYFKEQCERHVGSVNDLGLAPINMFPYRVARRLIRKITGKGYSFHHDPALARRYGAYYTELLRGRSYDLIFAAGAAHLVPYLETDIPIIYESDATWHVARDYYDDYTNMIDRCFHGGDELERRSIARSSMLVYLSDWAAESAIRDYGADPGKVFVIPPGANISNPPERESILPHRPGATIRLLLVGVSWKIKGGDIALEALLRLLEMGYDAELTVVGCEAPAGVSHPRMRVIPFLNRRIPEERERFLNLWRQADFLIFPTRCEAAGIVCCEASAYGLPSIATRTGGVPTLVRDGINGYTLPYEAPGDRYAEAIAGLVADPERYARLCATSRDEFENRLNWDRWGERLAEIIGERFPHLRGRLPQRTKLQSGIAPGDPMA